jgi:uncharacterized protein (DUF1778 family)
MSNPPSPVRRVRGRAKKTLRREQLLRAAAEASRGTWHDWTVDGWCDAAEELFPDETELFAVEKSVRWKACRRVRLALETLERDANSAHGSTTGRPRTWGEAIRAIQLKNGIPEFALEAAERNANSGSPRTFGEAVRAIQLKNGIPEFALETVERNANSGSPRTFGEAVRAIQLKIGILKTE